ncbi:MAG: hypothetical protein K9H65_02345, partial [Bacteroidales bacterium]|nr:hypothetical protein [Bacteroidales bacterium]
MRNGSARENKMPLICHFTSVHNRSDTRIFIRECCTLAESGYRVVLVVADGEGDAEKNDVKILDVGKEKN